MARRGAGTVREDAETATAIWRRAVEASQRGRRRGPDLGVPPPPAGDEWVRVDAEELESAAGGVRVSPVDTQLGADTFVELRRAAAPGRSAKLEKRLGDAARAYEREYFADARRILRTLVQQAPGVASVRELYGLTLYRLGEWSKASAELEVFRELTGSTEQHPVLADCYRALGAYDRVDELWEELRSASPSGPLVTEGRIVAAGALADQGDLAGAIRLLGKGWRLPKRPREDHLRRAYALADLYERAGELPRARELFTRVQAVDARFGDVGRRVRNLG